VARTGRRPGRPGEPETRDRIATAARATFGERGFEGTTIRAVAARAGVDPALVHHYFGTKQQLFIAVMDLPIDTRTVVKALVAGGEDGLGERLVRFILSAWDQPEVRSVFLGIVRSATTDPQAAAMLRELFRTMGPADIARALDRPDAMLRAELVGSQLIGLAIARYVVRVEPISSAEAEDLVAAIGPTMQRYLTGDIGQHGRVAPKTSRADQA